MTRTIPAPQLEGATQVDATKQDLLAEVLRRCMGLERDDNARHDFGEINGGRLQRPTEVAAELLRALSDEGLTIAVCGSAPARGGLREHIHAAVERIVENELTGVSSWRIDLTNRLTAAVLAVHEGGAET